MIVSAEDENGGYYDPIPPPSLSEPVDGIGLGLRIANLFLGYFVNENYISHVPIDHSSLVKFIEWNWFGKETGQL